MQTRVLGRATTGHLGAALCALALAAACSFSPKNSTGSGGVGVTSGAGGSGAGTGAGGSTGGSPGVTGLTISPSAATLMITNGGPAQTQQYKVTGMVNGQVQDLTGQVSYVISPVGVITISAGGLATTTGTRGGIVTVTASAGSATAVATLTVSYTFVGPDPGMSGAVPPNAPGIFTTTTNDGTRAPGLVYPNDGVLFPPNVSGIEIHFTPGANNTLFEVDLAGPLATVKSYIRCTAPAGVNGCIYLPDPGLWSSFALSNAGQGQVSLFVRGTDDSGTSVGASQTFHLQFSEDPIMGALYYWTTSVDTAIMRWDFGGSTTAPVQYLTPTNTDGKTCVGCHALAPDGTKLVASAGGQGDGRLLLWNISMNAALQPFPLSQKSQFESWNQDGSQFVGIYGDGNPGTKGPANLMIFDGTTGQVTQTIDLGGLRADHPDWSKNANGPETIAFTSVDATVSISDQRPARGGIDVVQLNGGTWSAPQVLVPTQSGKNRYYPAISPDGALVVFDESTCDAGTTSGFSCDADTDPTATMFLTPLSPGSAAPVALANANAPGVADGGNTVLTNSYPKWAPFVQKLDEMHQVYWLTFSSTRQYGLRAPPVNTFDPDENSTGELIWMFGVVVGPGNTDPSFTAFCLPFQDIATANHIAQWAKTFISLGHR
ncbi:MAG TPA: WD40 repeat domain-containing protein [Polyangia bacterium]|nr:WD40 repeat domain-containing protein [Polyangia bacterium]